MPRSWRPSVERLEGREVPSATVPDVDLSTLGSEGVVNRAIFYQDSPHPQGSGVMQPIVRLQAKGSTATVEQGYNTDARPLQFDENKSPTFTHSLKVGDIPEVSIGGVMYRQLSLNINQSTHEPYLSLDALKLYVGGAGNLTGYSESTGKLAGLSPIFDLDAGGDHWVKLNGALHPGSGTGDMLVNVPVSAFGGAGANTFLYLYSRFGEHFACDAGLEQWVAMTAGYAVPPPATAPAANTSISGHVYNDANWSGMIDTGEGLAGVTVTLTGTDSSGHAVSVTTTTDANGLYAFTGLSSGNYSLSEIAPNGYYDAGPNVGTVGGKIDGTSLSNNSIGQISLSGGDTGINYDFAEHVLPPA
ncbi:MAG: SdrD B-like domain-containing protein [Gemmataceae bacterium]